ncbi:MAG TPA: hypothetical protein VL354_02665 [Spirochaetia bacterium]|nr:hypothetical protein [Spirochaetia bacterium]
MKPILDKANHLNAHHVTMHLLRPPLFRRADSEKDELQSLHYQYYKNILQENLADLVKARGSVALTIENFHLETLAIDTLDEMYARGADFELALDWAKLHDIGGLRDKRQYSFYKRHSDRILEIHLHDMNKLTKHGDGKGQGQVSRAP